MWSTEWYSSSYNAHGPYINLKNTDMWSPPLLWIVGKKFDIYNIIYKNIQIDFKMWLNPYLVRFKIKFL